MKIAFAGNPNSGKTTMYNALTGQNERVGNWAGVTVDKKESVIRRSYHKGETLVAVDLPGAYSMTPFTSEEGITSEYVRKERPDVIVNIVDATNLSRSLFFTTQLMELGIPVVVALNKSDINKKKKTVIDTEMLSRELGCPVVMTVSTATGHNGLEELVAAAVAQCGKGQTAPYLYDGAVHSKKEAQAADRHRFAYVNRLVSRVEKRRVLTRTFNRQDSLDRVLTHPVAGLVIFAAVMFLVFQISQAWVGPLLADGYTLSDGTVIPGLVTLIDMFKDWVAGLLANANPFLAALLTEGIIGGVSAVVGFLPLVMVMYFLIALLEDCGYMARATVVLDPLFKKVGLSGRSVIPFVVGTGCAVPGVMAARTIRNERERNATVMLTPFMPCGAKLPVIGLFAGAFFPGASWVGTLMYFMGIAIIFLGALLVKRITGRMGRKSYFIIEMPEYKLPSFKRAALSMLSRGWSYIVKAGTIILLCNAIVYVMQSFTWRLTLVEEGEAASSILATVAGPIAVLLLPIGIHAWQMAAAAITGFIAKENVVGTLAVCYGMTNLIDTESLSMSQGAGTQVAETFSITAVAALAYLVFNLFSPPCFAAIGAMNAEVTHKKWLWGGLALQLGVGYVAAYLIYTVGTLLTAPETLAVMPAVFGLVATLGMALALWLVIRHADKKRKVTSR
ncbi:MAG: ferrous iron transport protein B [Ruminococcaceae bacterium]|nr:ferrous iron transport protein B [Oscillospiraceae bacterium]